MGHNTLKGAQGVIVPLRARFVIRVKFVGGVLAASHSARRRGWSDGGIIRPSATQWDAPAT